MLTLLIFVHVNQFTSKTTLEGFSLYAVKALIFVLNIFIEKQTKHFDQKEKNLFIIAKHCALHILTEKVNHNIVFYLKYGSG